MRQPALQRSSARFRPDLVLHPASSGAAARAVLVLATIAFSLAWLAPANAPAQGPGDERFLAVEEWRGHLSIRSTASGTQVQDLGTIEYSIDRHLSYPFTLQRLGGLPGTWVTCDVSLSRGTMDDTIVFHYNPSGCEQTIRHLVSASLTTPPPSPFPQPGAPPCGSYGFQLQILPMPVGGTYRSWGFHDSIEGEQTITLGGGGSCLSSSDTYPWSSGFNAADGRPICQGFDCLTLPDEGFTIVQSWSFDSLETIETPDLPVHYDVRLELVGCSGSDDCDDVELIVEIPGYDTWLPEAHRSGNESRPGADVPIRARLRKKDGGGEPEVKARRFRMELLEASRVPGVACNFPLPGAAAGDPKPDLAFYPERVHAPWIPPAAAALSIETSEGSYVEAPPATLTSFDWGAYGLLRVTAILEDGRTIVGHLETDPNATTVRIPKRKDGSLIGDPWLRSEGVEGLADNDDEEAQPAGDGHKGDGLTLYEEYRGFVAGDSNVHFRADPRRKELFIRDDIRFPTGMILLERASGLRVRNRIRPNQITEDRVINPNRGSAPSKPTPQHGLRIRRSSTTTESGLRVSYAQGGPGLPRSVDGIYMAPGLTSEVATLGVGNATYTVLTEDTVFVHEVLHAANVFHHGDTDVWSVHWLVANVDGRLVYTENGSPISVFTEVPGSPVGTPRVPSGPNDHIRHVWLGEKGGQHSGNILCFMKYGVAMAYRDRNRPSIRWLAQVEGTRLDICTSFAGTESNGPGHVPQPRYFDATVGCCKHQICVDDSEAHTAGATPSGHPPACSGGRSGGGGGAGIAGEDAEARAGQGAGTASPLPQLELEAEGVPGTEGEAAGAVLYRGWPLLITAEVLPAGLLQLPRVEEALVLALPGRSWTRAVSLRVFEVAPGQPGEEGVEVETEAGPWSLHHREPTERELRLDSESVGRAAWWLLPEETAAILPGERRLRATLDPAGATASWSDAVEAEPVRITVLDEPSPLPAALALEKLWRLALVHAVAGDFAAAFEAADALLALDPDDPGSLELQGDLLRLDGAPSADVVPVYEMALELVLSSGAPLPEPPAVLLQKLNELRHDTLTAAPPSRPFLRGDADGSGELSLADAITILENLFRGAPAALECPRAADANDSGTIDIADAVALLSHLYLGRGPLPAPSESCGEDGTADGLSCPSSPCP